MKLKNTLLALSAATVIATAGLGAGAASAETTHAEAQADSSSTFGSSSKDEGTEGTKSGSSEKFFGWDENTDGAEKFEDVTGVIGKVFEFVGKIVKIFLPF